MQPAAKLARMPVPAEVGSEGPCVRVYTVKEIAEMLKLSDDRVRDLFQAEPGVLQIGRPRSEGKRGYVTLRIPADVFTRVFRRLQRP
jgi:hypothetical protein